MTTKTLSPDVAEKYASRTGQGRGLYRKIKLGPPPRVPNAQTNQSPNPLHHHTPFPLGGHLKFRCFTLPLLFGMARFAVFRLFHQSRSDQNRCQILITALHRLPPAPPQTVR